MFEAKLVQAESNGARSNCQHSAEFCGVMKSRRKGTTIPANRLF